MKAWGKAVGTVLRNVGGTFLNKLYKGMPSRRTALLEARGGPIDK